ncbi:MAG: peptidoglycan editing factor PgeF [Prevotella sp.]|jgi:YfiH family protein
MIPELLKYDMGPGTVAFSTTRQGGVSRGAYASLNVNAYCGDAPECVAQNRQALATELGIPVDHIIIPHQVHDTRCLLIDREFFGLSLDDRQRQLEGIDAVMTQERGVCVGVSTADCIPVLLYDARCNAVAAVHAGWRGTQKRIVEVAVRAMQKSFGTMPSDLRCVIGPGIGLQSFEVGQEVYDAFANAQFDMDSIAKKMPRMHDDDPEPMKWHIHLKLCNHNQLLSTGVRQENIFDCNIDTYTDSSRFFSARRLGIESGRIFTAIMLQ